MEVDHQTQNLMQSGKNFFQIYGPTTQKLSSA